MHRLRSGHCAGLLAILTAIVFAAIDNLVKGGAGQGVQCLNVMFGLSEEAGLLTPPAQP